LFAFHIQRQRAAHAALARQPIDPDRNVRGLPLLAVTSTRSPAACALTTISSTIQGGRLTSQSWIFAFSPSYALRRVLRGDPLRPAAAA